jgi:hypothetical protein
VCSRFSHSSLVIFGLSFGYTHRNVKHASREQIRGPKRNRQSEGPPTMKSLTVRKDSDFDQVPHLGQADLMTSRHGYGASALYASTFADVETR